VLSANRPCEPWTVGQPYDALFNLRQSKSALVATLSTPGTCATRRSATR